MLIRDRTFVVTGGSSGLGLATCQDLHAQGGYIAILDLNNDAGEEAVATMGAGKAAFFTADVSESDSIEAAIKGVAQWIEQTGKPIGGIVSAAGVGNPGKVKPNYALRDNAAETDTG